MMCVSIITKNGAVAAVSQEVATTLLPVTLPDADQILTEQSVCN